MASALNFTSTNNIQDNIRYECWCAAQKTLRLQTFVRREIKSHRISRRPRPYEVSIRFVEDEHILHYNAIQIAKRGRWHGQGQLVARTVTSTATKSRPTHRVVNLPHDEAWEWRLRELCEKAVTPSCVDELSSTSVESYFEINRSKFVSAVQRLYGSPFYRPLIDSHSAQVCVCEMHGQQNKQQWTALMHHAAKQGKADALRTVHATAREDETDARLQFDIKLWDKYGIA